VKKIKEDRVSVDKVAGEGSSQNTTPFPNQAPPPSSEKRKWKDKKDKPKEDKKS